MTWPEAIASIVLGLGKELFRWLRPMSEKEEKPEPPEQQSANPRDVAIAVSSYHAAKRSLESATKK